MNNILILFAHPRFEKSKTNRALLKNIDRINGVTLNDLYEKYPDFNIDIDREKKLLLNHQIIIWQHPFYMYSAPALLKQWIDLLMEHGWAHGRGGTNLNNKIMSLLLLRFIARIHLRELFTAASLFIIIGAACIMMPVGLSPAPGTFLAGVVLANSEFRHELESDIEPFKGILLGLFFITVGASINFDLVEKTKKIFPNLTVMVRAPSRMDAYELLIWE